MDKKSYMQGFEKAAQERNVTPEELKATIAYLSTIDSDEGYRKNAPLFEKTLVSGTPHAYHSDGSVGPLARPSTTKKVVAALIGAALGGGAGALAGAQPRGMFDSGRKARAGIGALAGAGIGGLLGYQVPRITVNAPMDQVMDGYLDWKRTQG